MCVTVVTEYYGCAGLTNWVWHERYTSTIGDDHALFVRQTIEWTPQTNELRYNSIRANCDSIEAARDIARRASHGIIVHPNGRLVEDKRASESEQ